MPNFYPLMKNLSCLGRTYSIIIIIINLMKINCFSFLKSQSMFGGKYSHHPHKCAMYIYGVLISTDTRPHEYSTRSRRLFHAKGVMYYLLFKYLTSMHVTTTPIYMCNKSNDFLRGLKRMRQLIYKTSQQVGLYQILMNEGDFLLLFEHNS